MSTDASEARMGPRSRTLALLLAAVLGGGCGWRPGAASPPDAGGSLRPIALVATGSAFEQPGVRAAIVRALERGTGRRVVVLERPTSARDREARDLAARLARQNSSVARYDWREPRCGAQADVLTALVHDVDAVYRVALEYGERLRPATAEEVARDGHPVLRALGLVRAGTVREASLSGRVVPTFFGARRSPGPLRVSHTVVEVEPLAFAVGPDERRLAAQALRDLPPVQAPEWETLARRLTSAGCPFLALAVAETRLEAASARSAVRAAALAAIRQAVKRPARATAAAAAPDATAEAPFAATDGSDERYSCRSLCGMHMAELCNRDKELWDAHRTAWEPTPCGAMREEPFLKECYRRQWLSGAFHDSCLVPCERTAQGRDRLLRILRDGGCLRLGPS
ncbi:MAG TPA: hypothetical protein VE997_08840 [Candidatus Limnocylindria bacterium]|nr:hypothetical protein [Candidatus Limnocylindria bacterium]